MATDWFQLRIPHFRVPAYLDKPPTGQLSKDLALLYTMAACLPTLTLLFHRRRYCDFLLFGAGFVVACVYHYAQLFAHNGLAATSFLGLDGAGWRTIDILAANMLLARTIGHACNVHYPLLAAFPNIILPVAICGLLTSYPGVTLGLCSRLTMATLVFTISVQLAIGGQSYRSQLKQQYSDPLMWQALVWIAAGIVVFTLPTFYPDWYWICHSVWHVLMGIGCYILYQGLIDRHYPPWTEAAWKGRQRPVQSSAFISSVSCTGRAALGLSRSDSASNFLLDFLLKAGAGTNVAGSVQKAWAAADRRSRSPSSSTCSSVMGVSAQEDDDVGEGNTKLRQRRNRRL